MHSKILRSVVAVSVLVATIAAFIYYFVTHPTVRSQLRHTSPETLVLLLLLYGGVVVAVGLTLMATLVLCDIRLNFRESLLLTMYASIINFFGPLQSGPAFRAVYLKQKHGLKLKNYSLATLVYYGFYALFSGLFLLSGLLKWWLLLIIPLVLLGFIWLNYSHSHFLKRLRQLPLRGLGALALATLLQVVLIAIIYYTELRAVDPGVHLTQAIIYTGAANFALFVALTPGAIGFRESFLIFSQRLHHITNSSIVAANIIDRSVYIVLLLILVILIFGTHAQNRLRTKASEDR